MEKKTKKDKLLHTCDGKLNVYDYQEMCLNFKGFYWNNVLVSSILLVIITIIYGIFTGFISAIILFVVMEIYILIISKYMLKTISKNQYKNTIKKNPTRFEYETELYKDYLIRKSQNKTLKVNYSEIEKIVETDSNFYLKIKNMVMALQKSSCELDTITFIRNINKDILENRLGNDKTIKKFDKDKNKKIKLLLNVTFFLAILSLFIPIFVYSNYEEFTKINYLLYWFMLPFPLISFYLGNKYKDMGFECNKNIIGGICVALLLVIYGFLVMGVYNTENNTGTEYQQIEMKE